MADENGNFTVSKRKLATITLIVLSVLVLVAAALVIWQSKKLKEAKQELQNLTSVTATSTLSDSAFPAVKTATQTATVSATATATSGPDSRIGEIKTVAEKFMSAKQDRSLEEAKPYVTNDFLKNNSQDDFAGASSPSIGSFEIQSPKVAESGKKYSVDAIVYWKLGGQDSGTSTFNIEIIYSNGKFLVNSYSEMPSS